MSDYVHGGMDISGHKETWAGFCKLVKWSCIATIAVLIVLVPYLTS